MSRGSVRGGEAAHRARTFSGAMLCEALLRGCLRLRL
ncbi:hypothetical protein BKA18_000797 [Streptomyces auratus]